MILEDMHPIVPRAAITLVLVYALSHPSVAQYGLDNTYAGGGVVLTDMADSVDAIHGTTTQPDGKLVAVGWVQDTSGLHMGMARYEVDGLLDTSFSSDGRSVLDLPWYDQHAECVSVGSDGKILVGGHITRNDTGFMAVIRTIPDGDIDTAFGTMGVVMRAAGVGDGYVYNVAEITGGKILALGRANLPVQQHIVLYRFLPDGLTDSTFGVNGWVDVHAFWGAHSAQMAVQPDGRIVMVMTDTDPPLTDLKVMRLLPDGAVDSTFALNGTFLLDETDYDYGRDVALQSDGGIIVAWDVLNALGSSETHVLRLLTDGTLDASFGAGGIGTLATAGADLYTWEIRIDPSDRIVGAGRYYGPQAQAFAFRLMADGQIDPSFTATGIYHHDFTPTYGEAYSLELGPGGRVIMAGIHLVDFTYDQADFVLVAIRSNPVQGGEDHIAGGPSFLHDPLSEEVVALDHALVNDPLQVFDAQGRQHALALMGEGRWSTRHLPAGTYVVRGWSGTTFVSYRFAKW